MTDTIPLSPSLALERFLDTMSGDTAYDIGPNLTCPEVEAVADLFLANDRADDAKAWIEAHAEVDDCGDMHCQCDDDECIAERAEQT
ncbi:hypothetical protein N806_29675 [Rhodococcus sp. P27]|nr:hypothetical protein N806_29675 [Rhodococcus sp. P27]